MSKSINKVYTFYIIDFDKMSDYSSYQLPCKTFISCGTCAYRGRCHFIHDKRVFNKSHKSITKRENPKDTLKDTTDNIFYWPKMNISYNNNYLYLCENTNNQPEYNYLSIYSIWNHFIDTLNNNNHDNNSVINKYTNRNRLNIFVKLSNN